MNTQVAAQEALHDLLTTLDAEAWGELAEMLHEDVQLADELTSIWLRGKDAVSAYLRAQSGVVTAISSRPSSIVAVPVGDEHALVTFSLRQEYQIDGVSTTEVLAGSTLFAFGDDAPRLLMLHLGLGDEARALSGAEPDPVVDEVPATEPGSLGDDVKAFRTRAGLSLRQLAERTGLSASFLSQVERSVADPSVTSLRQIAAGLEVAVTDLLGERADGGSADYRLSLAADRAAVRIGEAGIEVESLQAPRGARLQSFVARLDGGELEPSANRVTHEERVVYVLSGDVLATVDGAPLTLGAGDALHVTSRVALRLTPAHGARARYIVVQPSSTSPRGEVRR